jgi:RimJ/RimL family protein N-acetyltransferase
LITFKQDRDLLRWAGDVIGATYNPDLSAWISKLNPDGTPLVVVVFDRFDEHNCQMHIASDGTKRWYSKEFVSTCYRYAFNQMNLKRVTVVIREDNVKSLKACKQLGHTQEGILKAWFGKKDGVLMRMLKTECKWL